MSPDNLSVGIRIWAGGLGVELDWWSGEGDKRLRGYIRADGECAIDTNGDPILEGSDGFEKLWESHYWAEAP